jgi:hypothetical protein
MHFTIYYCFILFFILYAEGMNEDGSFIGLYGKNKQSEISSTEYATFI